MNRVAPDMGPVPFFACLYLVLIALFLALDVAWIKLLARSFYEHEIGALLLADADLRWGAAVSFYLLYVAGLLLFAVHPALKTRSWRLALALGAAFGLVAYGTYDLTNLFALRGWSFAVAVVDMIWGSGASACVCVCGFHFGRWLRRDR